MESKVRSEAAVLGGRSVVLMDSIAYAADCDAGQVVVAGSHGGRSSGRFAIAYPLAACFLNDAGVGKDDAGIASLAMLDELGRAGATYDFNSARIGDAGDAWECGVISHVNRTAGKLGFVPGDRLADAIRRVFGAGADGRGVPVDTVADGLRPGTDEERKMGSKISIRLAHNEVILMDSTAYADASDAGHVVVAGSHGGLAGKYGGEIRLAGILLNDAGGGKEQAGIASLAVFDGVGVPAAAYSHRSARIGDAQDAWDNGIVSHVNPAAAALGIEVGEHVQQAVRRVFGGGAR